MNDFFRKFRGRLRRFGTAAAVFGVAWAVLAYFLGYYDFSFLDRYAVLDEFFSDPETGKTDSPFSGFFDDGERTWETSLSATEETGEDAGSGEDFASPKEDFGETESVLAVRDSAELADMARSYPLVADLVGYVATDASYDASTTVLAKMQFNYKLPTTFSLRRRVTKETVYVVPEEDGEYVAEYRTAREARPAVELYMGYLFIDNGKSLYLIDSDGTPLCSFNDNVYEPAYTRDSEGRPLFVKETAAGERYYYLSEDGKNFIKSEYDDRTDSRGLYFDYPAWWGLGDADGAERVWDESSERWTYRTESGVLTSETFTNAFAFSGGRACVTTTKNRGGMYFLDESGRQVQKTFQTYLSDLNRYSIWNYAMPASRGVESLGFFYYDHGLTRVRYQIIDNYNWYYVGRVRVVSDEDKLIREDGSVYELPVGYTLKGYSEGMILLEKNGKYGFMDYTGGWIAAPCYASATPFISGLSVLETEDGRFGMIDREGNIVLPFTYDYISQSSSGLIATYREENGWTVFRTMTKGSGEAPGGELDVDSVEE